MRLARAARSGRFCRAVSTSRSSGRPTGGAGSNAAAGTETITGFNAFEFWQYTTPVLTTVRSPAYEMGARGADEILNRLTAGGFEQSEIVFPVELQPGGST